MIDGQKQLKYWPSMTCQGRIEEFLNNFYMKNQRKLNTLQFKLMWILKPQIFVQDKARRSLVTSERAP